MANSKIDGLDPTVLETTDLMYVSKNGTGSRKTTLGDVREFATSGVDLPALEQSVLNLATSTGSVEGTQTTGYIFNPLNATYTTLPIDVDAQSTDINVFSIDDSNETVTFNTNANFNFYNTFTLESLTNSTRTFEFRVVNVADDSVVYSQSAMLDYASGSVFQLDALGLLTIGKNGFPSAPVTLRMELRQVEEDYSLVDYRAVISSSASYDVSLGRSFSGFSQHGIVPSSGINEIQPQDMFVEADVSNIARLSEEAKGWKVWFTDGIHDMNPSNFSLPLAPFASGSTDELLDDKVNGLTCQTAHSKGDIVVTGNELIANGTFATDAIGWTQGTVTDSIVVNASNQLEINSALDYPSAWYQVNLIEGLEYILKFDIISSDVPSQIRIGTATTVGTHSLNILASGEVGVGVNQTTIFTASVGSTYISFGGRDDMTQLVIDNISVQLKDQSFITLQDTIVGDLLTDTAKFKPISHVTKQVALLIEKTSSGVIQNTVKTLVNMRGEESALTYETDIFTELGCTQVANRVWTDGGSEFILLTLKGYLNAGSTQTLFNTYGRAVKGTNDGLTNGASSLYDSFTGQTSGIIGGTSGSSDGKLYDKTYLEGQGGLICFAIPNAKTPTYKHMEEVKRNLTDGYIENRGNIITHGSMTVAEELSDTSKVLWNLTYPAIEVYQVLYTTDSGVTWNIQTFTHDSVNNQITLVIARAGILVSYKALNQSAIPISTPQPVEHSDRDLIASNSHSEYAYNGLVYAGTGKVATGSSFESKGIENIGFTDTTPTHNAITLDGDSIVGVKALITQTANATQIFTQEMLYNVDWGDSDEFDSLTETTTTNLNGDDVQHKILYKPSSVRI